MRQVRKQRLEEALAQRIRHVRCAVEAVYHRHNVSAILRTCDALGLQYVDLVAGGETPALAPARGAERWLDITHHPGPEDAIRSLQAQGIRVYVADLDEHGVAPAAVPIDQPVCLWFGAEMVGPSQTARSMADGVMTLPMRGLAQSLNVSVAAALCLQQVAERSRIAHGNDALLTPAEHERLWAEWQERAKPKARDLTRR